MNKIIKIIFLSLVVLIGGLYLLGTGFKKYNNYRMRQIYEALPHEDWQKTQSGRYAHSLKYEDRLPKLVPFDISKPNFFTLTSSRQKKSEEYFEHLCKTEAGNYVWKTAEQPTDSVALLRSFELPTYSRKEKYNGGMLDLPVTVDDYVQTKQALESPINLDYFFAIGTDPRMFSLKKYDQNDFFSGYGGAYDRFQVVFNNNDIVDFKQGKIENYFKPQDREIIISNKLTSDYGITWKGFSRPFDREYGIAGGDLIIVNLKTNEIMAVQRNFAKARINRDKTNWYYPLGCFELYKNNKIINKLKFNENTAFEEKLKAINRSDNQASSVFPFVLHVLPPHVTSNDKDEAIYQKQIQINNIKIREKNVR